MKQDKSANTAASDDKTDGKPTEAVSPAETTNSVPTSTPDGAQPGEVDAAAQAEVGTSETLTTPSTPANDDEVDAPPGGPAGTRVNIDKDTDDDGEHFFVSVAASDDDPASGPCSGYVPDNAKNLFGPAIAPDLNKTGFDILLPPISMPTGKARIERWFGTLKSTLRQTPMSVIEMVRSKEMEYNVGKYAITMTQLRDLVQQCVDHHNNAPTGAKGGLSPNEQLRRHAQNNAPPKFIDIERVERSICQTDEAILDRNGVIYDGLRYRDKAKVKRLIRNMKALPGGRVKKRKDGTVAIVVKVRRNPGNLWFFQVLDEKDKEWIRLGSTEPEYTYMLSAGEHDLFQRRRKQRNETGRGKEGRLASVAKTRAEFDEMAPDLAFQQRRKFAALFNTDDVQANMKKSYGSRTTAEPHMAIAFDERPREDSGMPGDREHSYDRAVTNARGYTAADDRANAPSPATPHFDLDDDYDADPDEDIDFDDVSDLDLKELY